MACLACNTDQILKLRIHANEKSEQAQKSKSSALSWMEVEWLVFDA